MTLNFIVNGKTLTEADIRKAVAPVKKAAKETLKRVETVDEASRSDGFVVLGYEPGYWDSRIEDHKRAAKKHAEDPTHNKPAGTLEEFTIRWMKKNKPKRARTKPYELEQSADLCADLMRKAGWVHVRVEEILKG